MFIEFVREYKEEHEMGIMEWTIIAIMGMIYYSLVIPVYILYILAFTELFCRNIIRLIKYLFRA